MPVYLTQPKALAEGNNLLRGTLNLSRAELAKYAPQYTGQTQIFVVKNVRFMEEGDATAKKHASNLKNLLEFCSLSYSGTPDLSAEDATVETGFSNVEISVPTGSKYDGTSFSIRVLEQDTEVLRHALEFYQNGVFDSYGNYVHMQGSLLAFSPENYTMELVIVQLDPTLKKIQDISMWQAVRPKPVDRDNLNWQQGQIEVVQPKDVQFTGRYIANADAYLSQIQELVDRRITMYKTVKNLIL
jgi:hypothetical protein